MDETLPMGMQGSALCACVRINMDVWRGWPIDRRPLNRFFCAHCTLGCSLKIQLGKQIGISYLCWFVCSHYFVCCCFWKSSTVHTLCTNLFHDNYKYMVLLTRSILEIQINKMQTETQNFSASKTPPSLTRKSPGIQYSRR